MGAGGREEVGGEGAGGVVRRRHAIRVKGSMIWCDRCGSYSTLRAGVRLKGDCEGLPTSRHRVTRLGRLRLGRHPITNVPLEG